MTEVIAGCTTGIDTVWVRSLLKKKLPYLLESNDRKFDRIFYIHGISQISFDQKLPHFIY